MRYVYQRTIFTMLGVILFATSASAQDKLPEITNQKNINVPQAGMLTNPDGIPIPLTIKAYFSGYITAAQHQAEQNHPEKALHLFQQALVLSGNNPTQARVALFGIAKMQLWLEQYPDAETSYCTLYHQSLRPDDQQIALEGLVRSINYQDRAKEAYQLVPVNIPITQPGLVIALAQAYLAAELPAQAQALLKQNPLLLKSVPADSNLGKQLNKLEKQILAYQTPKKRSIIISLQDQQINELLAYGREDFNREDYEDALIDYNNALFIARAYQKDEKNILFRIGEVYLATGDFKRALVIYKTLLFYPLNKGDYEVALNGYVESLGGRNLPMKAYRSIPPDFDYTMPVMVVSAAEMALWSNWPYKSMAIINAHQTLIDQIPPNSTLKGRYDDVIWQDRLATATNEMGYNTYHEKDTDNFSIFRNQAWFSHRFDTALNTTLLLNKNRYAQPGEPTILGTKITAQADGWLNDSVYYLANIAPSTLGNWHPVLANGFINIATNDYYAISVNANRDIVESIPAIINKIAMNNVQANGTIYPFYRLQLSGAVLSNHFTDDNTRNGANAYVKYLVSEDAGLYASFFWRSYSNSKPSPYYFSPEHYWEKRFNLMLNRHLTPTWRYYFNGGLGTQQISTQSQTPTKFLLMGARGPIGTHLVIDIAYGYNSASGSSATGFARRYETANITYII